MEDNILPFLFGFLIASLFWNVGLNEIESKTKITPSIEVKIKDNKVDSLYIYTEKE